MPINKWAELLDMIIEAEDKQLEICKDQKNRVNCVECQSHNVVSDCPYHSSASW